MINDSPHSCFLISTMSLKGIVCLVTGAASGIGRSVCVKLDAEGAIVIGIDIDADELKQTNDMLSGTGHLTTTCNVSNSTSIEALSELILEKYAPPTVIVNCAATINHASIFETSEERFDQTINVNLKGTFLICRKFGKILADRGLAGSIINFSSQAAKGAAYMPDYSASKGGIESLTKALAKELGPIGIRVNAINPGVIDTPQSRQIPNELREKCIQELTPLRRIGQPEEVADLCVFLASDKAVFCTGAVYEITGGFSI